MDNKILFRIQSPHQEIVRDGRIWFSILLAVNLINLPNLIACFIPFFSWLAVTLWISSTALMLLLCVFGLRVRLMLWLALPLILLVPACLVCLLTLNNLPSTF